MRAFHATVTLSTETKDFFSVKVTVKLGGGSSTSCCVRHDVRLTIRTKSADGVIRCLHGCTRVRTCSFSRPSNTVTAVHHVRRCIVSPIRLHVKSLIGIRIFLGRKLLSSTRCCLGGREGHNRNQGQFLARRGVITMCETLVSCAHRHAFSILSITHCGSSMTGTLATLRDAIQHGSRSGRALSRTGLVLAIRQGRTRLGLLLTLLMLILTNNNISLCIHGQHGQLVRTRRQTRALAQLLRSTAGGRSGRRSKRFFQGVLLRRLNVVQLITGRPASRGRRLLHHVSNVADRRLPMRDLLM